MIYLEIQTKIKEPKKYSFSRQRACDASLKTYEYLFNLSLYVNPELHLITDILFLEEFAVNDNLHFNKQNKLLTHCDENIQEYYFSTQLEWKINR